MKTFDWDQNFATGIEEVDDQHRFLVELINRFGQAMATKPAEGDVALLPIVSQLVDYAQYHFANEENLMLKAGVAPAHRERHMRAHADFARQVSAMWTAREASQIQAPPLYEFLCAWLATHVLGEDQEMGRQIALIEAGHSPEAAFSLASRAADPSTASLLAALQNMQGLLSERNLALGIANARVIERGKELHCRYAVSMLVASSRPIAEVLAEAASLIPPAFAPTATCARIVWEGQCYHSANFRETPWQLRAQVANPAGDACAIEVFYLAEDLAPSQGVFTAEKQSLLVDVVQNLCTAAERSRVAAALQESQAIFAMFMANSPIYAFIKEVTATESRVVQASENYQQMVGIPGSQMVGKTMPELFPADLAQKFLLDDQSVVTEGKVLTLAEELDGRSYSTIKFPIRYQGKTLLAGYTIDITERKAAEEALRQSEATFKKLFDDSADAMALSDSSGVLVQCNQAALDLLKMTREQFVLLAPADVSPEYQPNGRKSGELAREMIQKAYRDGLCRFDWTCLNTLGAELVVEVSLMPIVIKGQAMLHVTLHDVTRRKNTEIELARHKEHLELLVAERTADLEARTKQLSDTQFAMEKVGIGIAWNDAATGRFLYANEEVCRQLGYGRDELLSLTVSDVNPDFSPDAVAQVADGLRQSGGGMRLETRHRRKGGSVFPVEVTFYLQRDPGGDFFIAFHSDITARKEAESELLAAKEVAEAANRAKSAFLANMSHELRTPLNGIMGMTELALRSTQDPKQRDQLGKALQSSRHLLHVINDILDISKIEAERMQLEQVDFTLAQALDNFLRMMDHKATDKGLKFLLQLQPGLPTRRFTGDPTRVVQILVNLVGNALKFTDHGAITVAARVVEEAQDSALLRWEVADTGIGIPAEAQARLFSAFEQADNSMTRKYGGSGLGLAICKRLVHMMGGDIGVRSSVGQGSTFWFTLRLNKPSDATAAAPDLPVDSAEAQLQTHHHGARILLAEDEPVSREVAVGLLEQAGLVVDVADNGQQALELARQNRYALILMDVQMPKLNGMDASRAILADSLNRTTPILAMTANVFDDDRQRCREAGMVDHIAKPVDPEQLYTTLLGWL